MSTYTIVRTDEEISDLMNDTLNNIDEDRSRFPGQRYEEGVAATLDWLFGNIDDHPYPEA